jgi:hypothetical protein
MSRCVPSRAHILSIVTRCKPQCPPTESILALADPLATRRVEKWVVSIRGKVEVKGEDATSTIRETIVAELEPRELFVSGSHSFIRFPNDDRSKAAVYVHCR